VDHGGRHGAGGHLNSAQCLLLVRLGRQDRSNRMAATA
jgi:hypothetical protein